MPKIRYLKNPESKFPMELWKKFDQKTHQQKQTSAQRAHSVTSSHLMTQQNIAEQFNTPDSTIELRRRRGPGGAPTRTTVLPEDPSERKKYPVATGVLDYFPDALVEISRISQAGNDQHNPGLPLRWTRSKSGDEADTCIRHFLQRGTKDTDGMRHTAKAAWRMLALLQKEIESEQK